MKLSYEEKLNKVLNYIKFLNSYYKEGDVFFYKRDDLLFDYMIHLFDYDKLPKILKNRDYKFKRCTEYYRGVSEQKYHLNFLRDYSYHTGRGVYGSGKYVTDDETEAIRYAKLKKQNILRLKFSGKLIPITSDIPMIISIDPEKFVYN